MGLHSSNVRHHLLVKMAVEKNVKTGNDVNKMLILIDLDPLNTNIGISSVFDQN